MVKRILAKDITWGSIADSGDESMKREKNVLTERNPVVKCDQWTSLDMSPSGTLDFQQNQCNRRVACKILAASAEGRGKRSEAK
ncbi:hypothetical protein Tco_1316118 [Tanacetum coccineum]